MEILLISISAPPKNSPESLQTGRYLKYLCRHHSVSLLTTDVTGGWEPEDKGLLKYLAQVKTVISLRSIPSRVISIVKRVNPAWLMPDESMTFFWQQKKAIKKIKTKPDIVFSRSAPYSSAVMGLKMAQHWNIPWVMHLSDLWVDSPFFQLTESLRKKHDHLEKLCFEQACVITLTSEKTIDFYQAKYPKIASKFKFLPNVFDVDDLNKRPISLQGKLKFVFTGRLYGSRSIHSFLQAMESAMKASPDLEDKCEVLLAGFFDAHNIDRIKNSSLKNVAYLGSLPLDEAIELQQQAHVLISIDSLDQDERYNLFFPSKLLDYIATKRLIIALTNKKSTTYDVVEGKLGKCFHAENINELPSFIQTLVAEFVRGSIQALAIEPTDILQYEASVNSTRLETIFQDAINAYG